MESGCLLVCHVDINPPLVPILSQMNPVLNLRIDLFKIHFNRIVSSSLSLEFSKSSESDE